MAVRAQDHERKLIVGAHHADCLVALLTEKLGDRRVVAADIPPVAG